MKSNIRHNKLRNTGILFELLVRQVTADVMANKKNSLAVKLMQEFFNSKTELGKELILYRAFFNTKNISEQKSFELLKLVSEQRKTLNQNALNLQKYLLIKEIKAGFELKEFLSTRVPSYKIYASIYKVFDAATSDVSDISSIDELAASKFTIVEHLSSKSIFKDSQSQLAEVIRSQPVDTRYTVYKILLEKFNEKYKDLDDKQKKLLQEYIYNISNTTALKDYIVKESKQLSSQLDKLSESISDSVVKIKVSEVATQLNKMKSIAVVKENHMTAMLIAYEMVKELNNLRD